ncbi:phage tail assembly chaperone family protein, TAC [Chitiniphilus eburneus]|uniref:phage tail assembly chaperone family protein, TAC n=1 Tax=Chitiniphilus eburneus TaxID=2571148 RepID=UPI0035D04846
MNKARLRQLGGFVPVGRVREEIRWTQVGDDGQAVRGDDGEPVELTATIYVRRQPFGLLDRLMAAGNDERSRSAVLISESVFLGDDGSERITYDEAYQLRDGLAAAMLLAINRVNGRFAAPGEPKNSTPPTSSGASSSSMGSAGQP